MVFGSLCETSYLFMSAFVLKFPSCVLTKHCHQLLAQRKSRRIRIFLHYHSIPTHCVPFLSPADRCYLRWRRVTPAIHCMTFVNDGNIYLYRITDIGLHLIDMTRITHCVTVRLLRRKVIGYGMGNNKKDLEHHPRNWSKCKE